MTIREDESIELNLTSIDNITDRSELRRLMLNTFIIENCKTKYRYFVETLIDGNRIYIERPGRLNKGCDFVIYVENLLLFGNGNDKYPKHDDFLDDLKIKKKLLRTNQYNLLLDAIHDIYQLRTYQSAFNKIKDLPNKQGWSYELLLKLVRWFFIEQDITYWSKSGREMLYNEIKKTI